MKINVETGSILDVFRKTRTFNHKYNVVHLKSGLTLYPYVKGGNVVGDTLNISLSGGEVSLIYSDSDIDGYRKMENGITIVINTMGHAVITMDGDETTLMSHQLSLGIAQDIEAFNNDIELLANYLSGTIVAQLITSIGAATAAGNNAKDKSQEVLNKVIDFFDYETSSDADFKYNLQTIYNLLIRGGSKNQAASEDALGLIEHTPSNG
jgi:hypothetical protein